MDKHSPVLKKRCTDTESEAVAVPQTSCSNNSSSSVESRKNAKDAGNKRLLFYPSVDIKNVQETLEKTKGNLDVEFHLSELFLIPQKTWEVCGSRIRSVTWYSIKRQENIAASDQEPCRGSSELSDSDDVTVLKWEMNDKINQDYHRKVQAKYGDVWWTIFSHCPNLEFFDHRREYCDNDPIEKVLTKSLLQKLVEANIVYDRVYSLTESLSLDELKTGEIFQVFPNLRKISFAGVDKQNLKEELVPDFSNLPVTIDKLHFDRYRGKFYYSGDSDTSLFLYYVRSPHVNIKLKELKAQVEIRPDVHESLFQFFSRLSELEVLELAVDVLLEKESVEKFKTELVIHILKSCNLTKLTIHFSCKRGLSKNETSSDDAEEENLPFNEDLVQKMRQLHTINVNGFDTTKYLPSAIVSVEGNLTCFENPVESSRFIQLLICNMFKHLAYLSIGSNVTDETEIINLNVLKTISKALVNLKTLVIRRLKEANVGDPWSYEPTTKEKKEWKVRLSKLKTIPAISFEQLEHLEMGQGMFMLLIVFSEFHFPLLKHLIVTEVDTGEALNNMYDTVRNNIEKILDCLPERVPLLEMLHNDIVFYFKRHIFSDCVKFVKRMQKLEIFSFSSDDSQYPMTAIEMAKVYQMRPSLKVIIHCNACFYNRQTRKIVSRSAGSGNHDDPEVMYFFKSGPCCNFLKN